ncbi:hypothetical protein DL96DRAFT_39490 [Flagelloscypha sp. PMI_526]|nr:hypothetical protein DL96DRAFT_39490 [Flagelloscypha sp. PMI_526]
MAQEIARSITPKRVTTVATPHSNKPVSQIARRLIVCCDGTWQDGVSTTDRLKYTNVLRLARAIDYQDARYEPPIPQIVFYQSGVGSQKNLFSTYIDGVIGATLADKVEEAYAFIAHNYTPGDEIFLFGFSRGAYTARMVAMMIGAIGILDRQDMDHFASIFLSYQKLANCDELEEKDALEATLTPWNQPTSPGRVRAAAGDPNFSIKCVGVWDTVGSIGLPEELKRSDKIRTLFGFPDLKLGEHIGNAFQALAADEVRKDFTCAKFEQTAQGKAKKQVLKQCWFSGSHADVGGGLEKYDLSFLTLVWMCANVEDILSLDHGYVQRSKPQPATAPWGAQPVYSPLKGIFALSKTQPRETPQHPVPSDQDETHERIHPSILDQPTPQNDLAKVAKQHPEMLWKLLPLEIQFRAGWTFDQAAAVETELKKVQETSLSDVAMDFLSNTIQLATRRD